MSRYRFSALAASCGLVLALGLAGCDKPSATTTVTADTATATNAVSTITADTNEGLTIAEAALAAYAATKNPSQAVLKEAQKLDTAARNAVTQYGPEATVAIAAASALAEYLLTSAPGNGVTPSTVPVASAS
jgi:hypothetical protein